MRNKHSQTIEALIALGAIGGSNRMPVTNSVHLKLTKTFETPAHRLIGKRPTLHTLRYI
jgi:hypothetical protein